MSTMSIDSTATVHRGTAAGRWLGLTALVLSLVSIGLVLFILVIALPTLAVKLNATTSDLQWILGAFQVAVASLMLPAGFLGDRFGRKLGIVAGAALFGVASLAGTQATSAGQLIAVTAVMGVAAAILIPLTLSILPVMFPEEGKRRLAVGLLAAANFLTLPLGPLAGGWLLKNFNWDSIFWINLPFVIVGVLGTVLFVPESRDPSARRLDLPGTLLSVAGVSSLVFGIIREPIDGWGHPRVWGTLAAGVVLLAVFIAWERVARQPLVDLRLFARPAFAWSTFALCIAFFGLVGGLFLLTPFLQIVQGNDVMSTGIRLLPLIVAMVILAGGSNRLTPRLGTKVMVSAGLAVMAGGLTLLAQVTATTGYGPVAVALAVIGIGMGAVLAPAFDAILVSLPDDQRGVGSAVANAIGKLAQAIGIVLMGSILNNTYRGQLGPHLTRLPVRIHDAALASVPAAAAVAHRLPPAVGGPLLTAAKDAYISGMSEVLLVTAAVSLVGAGLVAVLLPNRPGAVPTARSADSERRSA